ncbi:MAG TPA: Crp/Fnr family transcriptional regulator [Clostridiales bacterium]|jgi:CRP/FNR family transcriptional regulator|nr:Crp/Fnr family transcriptional regulator [Clostridiales bacterium]
MEEAGIRRLLERYFPAWRHMSERERAALIQNTTPVSYKKGTSVHGGESECIGVLLIRKGMLRTSILSEEGREVTLFRLGEGDLCILTASCVMEAITFDVHVDAEEDTEALLINAPFFAKLKESNVYVECSAYKITVERFSDVMWAMQQILFMSMDKRLAVFLWDELSKARGDTIYLTHEQIARYIGSAREVVSRMLKYFAQEGIVELSRGGIKILDKAKLKSIIK